MRTMNSDCYCCEKKGDLSFHTPSGRFICTLCRDVLERANKAVLKKYQCSHDRIEPFGEGFRRCADCGTVEPPYTARNKS